MGISVKLKRKNAKKEKATYTSFLKSRQGERMKEVDEINEIWHEESRFLPRIMVWIKTKGMKIPVPGYYRDRKFFDENWNEIKMTCEWKYRD